MDIVELLTLSVEQGASDLHLSAGLPPLIRVDGDLRRLERPPLEDRQARDMVCQLMNERQRRAYEQDMAADFSCEVPGAGRFRGNAFQHHRGAGGAFRAIPAAAPSLEELALGSAADTLMELAELPRGLILVTGPTGSGKSTTLAAMLDCINGRRSRHILTIEDPIEFVHASRQCLIHQREIHRDAPSFNAALRAALREDPDIILVGELRDLETIRLALQAAETGHLVFATLHTQSAAKTIDRIIDVFPGGEQALVRAMLSESLQAVVSQTLLRKIGGGRIAACELMRATPAIRHLIRENKTAQMYSAIQTGAAQGMRTLDQNLRELADNGIITPAAARQAARSPEQFTL